MFFAKFRGWMTGKEAAAHAKRISNLISAGRPWEQSDVDKSIVFWAQDWRCSLTMRLNPCRYIPKPSGLIRADIVFSR